MPTGVPATDRWIFLALGLALLAVWAGAWAARPDLRPALLKLSALGAVAGLVSEHWYFRDYWRPPTVVGTATLSPEDALFGFAVTGVAVAAHKVAFRRRLVPGAERRYPVAAGLGAAGLGALLIGTDVFGVNSILVSSGAFLGAAGVMAAIRRDLLRPAVESAALLVTVVLPIYAVLFDVVAPAYWDRYWLLAGTPLGVTVLGNIPVTEIVWYASWGAVAGVGYEFTTGRRLVRETNAAGTVTRAPSARGTPAR